MRPMDALSGIVLICLAVGMGCRSTPAPAQGSDSEIKKLGIICMRFVGKHRGKAPVDRAELDTFLEELGQKELAVMGISKPDAVFHSSRDNQPIVIRYGITIPPPGPGLPTVIAYEKEGFGGQRLVAFATAGVEQVNEARLKELVPEFK